MSSNEYCLSTVSKIEILEVQKMSRSNVYRIKLKGHWKRTKNSCKGWLIYNLLKMNFENDISRNLRWDNVTINVFSNYVEIPFK